MEVKDEEDERGTQSGKLAWEMDTVGDDDENRTGAKRKMQALLGDILIFIICIRNTYILRMRNSTKNVQNMDKYVGY